MAQEFQTSFIPKKSAEVNIKHRRSSMSILTLGGIVVFIVGLLLAGGVFGYQKLLEKDLTSKKEVLEGSREAFEPSLIKELVRLDSRIESSRILLENHVAMSHVLQFLEEHTLETVQFEDFTLSKETDGLLMSLRGRARGFTSVALQSDVFGESTVLKGPLFADFAIDLNGDVTFTVSAGLDSSLIAYEPPSISVPEPVLSEPDNAASTSSVPSDDEVGVGDGEDEVVTPSSEL